MDRRRMTTTTRLHASLPTLLARLALALTVSLALASPASAFEQKLTASDGAALDQLGYSVAIDGDTLVAGAIGDDAAQGAVYVFQRSGGSWVFNAKLTASDGAANDFLGTSVAIDGDTIVAGAYGDDSLKGSVYTFTRSGAAARTQTAKLTASDGAANDFLGASVAIEGDTIVAGAYGDDAIKGSAYTFARSGAAARTQTAKVTASDGAANDFLGYSVAIDGDTIVAGAYGDDGGKGSAYTFARNGATARTQTAKLTASDAAVLDSLGFSIAIDGNTIVAGAHYVDINKGAAYTFARSGAAARTQTAKLTASDAAPGDSLGASIAIDGDTIVAGAYGDDGTRGSAYTFARSGAAARTQTAKLTASDGAASDFFGYSVAIAGETIATGASGDDGAKGSVSVFSPTTPPAPVATPAVSTPPPKKMCKRKRKAKKAAAVAKKKKKRCKKGRRR